MSLILVHLMEDGFNLDHLCLVGVEVVIDDNDDDQHGDNIIVKKVEI